MIEQKLHDALKKKCPKCGKMKLYQDLTGQHSFVYQECKTLGHQASRNTERMGKYELEHKRKKHRSLRKESNKPWYNSDGKNLKQELKHLDTIDKAAKYIETGVS
jgi:acetyl-CoA carboxylase beta subunit